jgi:PAS domain S-box-containing protein
MDVSDIGGIFPKQRIDVEVESQATRLTRRDADSIRGTLYSRSGTMGYVYSFAAKTMKFRQFDKGAFCYVPAVLAAAAALYFRYLLVPLLGTGDAYELAWLAVSFSTWCCGLWPSILCAVLCAFGTNYLFLPPAHSFWIHDPSQQWGFAGFLILSGAIIALGESSRRAQASRYKLAAIVDSSNDAIVSKTLGGVITSWNRAAERMFGWTAKEAVGQPITMIIPPELHGEELGILRRLRAGERIELLETVRRKKSGEQIEVALTISPVCDRSGTVIGASKIARDLTERRRAEVRLRAAYDQLESRVEERTAELLVKNEQLTTQTEAVRGLSGQLLQAQDDERRRIARELHDSVGQLLAAISINASRISREKNVSPEAKSAIEDNLNLVVEAISEVRTISYLLHPPLLDELGLASTVKSFVEGFGKRSGIRVALIISPGFDRLNHDVELTIFRIVQGCLTNIHKHSGSQTAQVYLAQKDGHVRCEVSDQGIGMTRVEQETFDSANNAGVGLRGMQERVRQLGGVLQIRSSGKGTTVEVVLPIR